MSTESKANYNFAREHFDNFLKLTNRQRTYVLVNWDPYTFPPIYFQNVDGQGANITFIGTEMAHGNWYNQRIAARLPEIQSGFQAELRELTIQTNRLTNEGRNLARIVAVKEAHQKFLTKIVELAMEAKIPLYTMQYPKIKPLSSFLYQGYKLEPVGVAWRFRQKNSKEVMRLKLSEFHFESFHLATPDRLSFIWKDSMILNLMMRRNLKNISSEHLEEIDDIIAMLEKTPH